jgi:hypothetical protein
LSEFASKRRDDVHLAEFEGSCRESASKGGEIVLVGSADLFDEAVFSESFEHSRDLLAGLAVQECSKAAVLESVSWIRPFKRVLPLEFRPAVEARGFRRSSASSALGADQRFGTDSLVESSVTEIDVLHPPEDIPLRQLQLIAKELPERLAGERVLLDSSAELADLILGFSSLAFCRSRIPFGVADPPLLVQVPEQVRVHEKSSGFGNTGSLEDEKDGRKCPVGCGQVTPGDEGAFHPF